MSWWFVALFSAVPSARAQSTSFMESWAASTSPYFIDVAPGQSEVTFNVAASETTDDKALRLKLAPYPSSGPGGGPEVETIAPHQYGTFSTRLKTADCSAQPQAGVVTGFFTYFNDGGDYNGNGLPDNSEIDFEWLCAEPEVVYMTMWTDYSDGGHRQVGRAIDLATGAILYTCYFERFGMRNCEPLTGNENAPSAVSALPGYDSSAEYYEYGFTWTATRVTWWIVNPARGQKVTLWDYQGPASRIPSRPAYYMTNVWHSNGWAPFDNPTALEQPTSSTYAYADWTSYTAPNSNLVPAAASSSYSTHTASQVVDANNNFEVDSSLRLAPVRPRSAKHTDDTGWSWPTAR